MPQSFAGTFPRVVLALLLGTGIASLARGQINFGGQPSIGYYKGIGLLYEGNFGDAMELIRSAGRAGTRTVDGRWYDAICYHAMMGECFYSLGNLSQALDQYNNALSILVASPDWFERIQFPVTVGPLAAGPRTEIPWTPPGRTSVMGDFSDSMQVLVGRLDNSDADRRSGVIAPPQYSSLNVGEVVRCIGVALRRRIELLGPLCPQDQISTAVLNALEGVPGTGTRWSQPWLDVQRGLALAGMGRRGEAAATLERSVLIGGTYTHPSSGIALFELGRLMAAEQRYQEARKYFLDASVAAAEYRQYMLVEECFAQATAMHVFLDNAQPLVALPVATEWARREGARHLTAGLLVATAENLAAVGRIDDAATLVNEARKARTRRSGLSIQLGARLDHQAALMAFHARQLPVANAALSSAIQLQQSASPWIFQIGLASQWYLNRAENISSRTAADLFDELLREPTADDWIRNTLDTLAVHLTPQSAAYENWLEVALERGETEKAFHIAELLRQHRYYTTLPMGGRLLSLRWLMEAPQELLPPDAWQRRQDMLRRFPEYAKASRRAAELKTLLEDAPWAYDRQSEDTQEQAAVRKYQRPLVELQRVSEQQELMLGELALRREAVPHVFPPMVSTESLQHSLGPSSAAILFTSTSRGIHVFLVANDGLFYWRIQNPVALRQQVSNLLRSIGLTQENGSVSEKVLENQEWPQLASQVLQGVVDRTQYGFWRRFDELVVVPDDFLWYLPFEVLLSNPATRQQEMLQNTRIRYAAAAGLISLPDGPRARFPKTIVVKGKLFPRDEAETLEDRLTELRDVVDDVVAMPQKPLAPTGLGRCLWDRLVVLDEISDAIGRPLEWSPGRVDANRPDGSMARWLHLPWGAPREVILPGFRSAAETAASGSSDGHELALAILNLMSAGTRSVIISRWRTGGQTCHDLCREYLQEADHLSPARAWQRGTWIVRDSELDPEWEPRLNHTAPDVPLSADHPFFWAGYLVADQGETVQVKAATPDAPEPATAQAQAANVGPAAVPKPM